MKYKAGDKVKIKSLEWYKENKDDIGIVECGEYVFGGEMREYCGKVLTINEVNLDLYEMCEDGSDFAWTDEMIECLVSTTTPHMVSDKLPLYKEDIKKDDDFAHYMKDCEEAGQNIKNICRAEKERLINWICDFLYNNWNGEDYYQSDIIERMREASMKKL